MGWYSLSPLLTSDGGCEQPDNPRLLSPDRLKVLGCDSQCTR